MRNKQFRELVFFNATSNLKSEMNSYALSYLWWIIEPGIHLLILYVVFGIFFEGNTDPHFIPFLFCGLVPWFWFNKSISNGLGSVVGGRNIIKDTYIPKYFFPTVSIIQDTIKELVVFIILILVLIISGVYPTKTWALLPFVMFLEFLLITSVVYLVSIITPYFLDLKYVISTFLQVVMFSAGTFYDFNTMPEVYHKFFLLNPMALLLKMYRDVMMYNKPIDLGNYFYILSIVFVLGFFSYFLHKKLDKKVAKVLFR